jgi:ketosteroid isomerase-like protein
MNKRERRNNEITCYGEASHMISKFHVFAYMIVVTFGTAVCPAAWAADESANTGDAIMKLENDWCAALIKNDVAALNAILADDLTEVAPSGAVGTKASILSGAKSTKVSVCKNENMKVRVYGDAAVARGVVAYQDSNMSGEFQFTDTYVRRNGHWQCVATHETPSKK